jgi:hypothetical protein
MPKPSRAAIRGLLAACVGGVVLLPAGPLAAQAAPGLEPGARVRVTAPSIYRQPEIAVFETIDATDLRIGLIAGGHAVIPLDAVHGIEVSAGRRTNRKKGALIGGLAGLTGGLVIVLIDRQDRYGDESVWAAPLFPEIDRAIEAAGITIMTLTGAGLGMVVGTFVRTERWQAAAPPRVHVGIAPVRGGGAGITVSLRP